MLLDGAAPDGAALDAGAVLDGAALDGAALDGAALDGGALDAGAVLDGAVLDGAVLDGATVAAGGRAPAATVPGVSAAVAPAVGAGGTTGLVDGAALPLLPRASTGTAPAVQAELLRPAAVRPSAVRPSAVRPAVVRPAVVRPAVVRPAVVDPAVTGPAAVDQAVAEPAAVPAGTAAPVGAATTGGAAAGVPGWAVAVPCGVRGPDPDPAVGAEVARKLGPASSAAGRCGAAVSCGTSSATTPARKSTPASAKTAPATHEPTRRRPGGETVRSGAACRGCAAVEPVCSAAPSSAPRCRPDRAVPMDLLPQPTTRATRSTTALPRGCAESRPDPVHRPGDAPAWPVSGAGSPPRGRHRRTSCRWHGVRNDRPRPDADPAGGAP